jgi:hypothetical protein
MTAQRKTANMFRPTLEALENRLVPTIGITGLQTNISGIVTTGFVPDWFQFHLADTGMRNVARADFNRDGTLTRTDMLQLFGQAEADGTVSDLELHDLQTIVACASTLNMRRYVSDLTNKVVNANPANAFYQYVYDGPVLANPGAGAISGAGAGSGLNFILKLPPVDLFPTGQVQTVALGNLQAGDPASKLQNLVNKWFYGMDMPLLGSTDYRYGNDTQGSLFGGGITYGDIKQGVGADCYYLSALATVANESTNTIKNAFIDNADGTFTVRLFNNGAPTFVTVNRLLPEDSNGNFVYANLGKSLGDASAKLWVPLLEKAMAQVNRFDANLQGTASSYASLDYGWAGKILPHITNRSASFDLTLDKTKLTNAVQSGQLVCLSTPDRGGTTTIDGYTIVSNHEYAVVGYNPGSARFFVFNPWGFANGGASDFLALTYRQITDIFDSWDDGVNPSIYGSVYTYRSLLTYTVLVHPLPITLLIGEAAPVSTAPVPSLAAGTPQDVTPRDVLFGQLGRQEKVQDDAVTRVDLDPALLAAVLEQPFAKLALAIA